VNKQTDPTQDPPVRPQVYVSVLIIMVIIVLMYMGQWDWVLAVFIGLIIGNGLTGLTRR